MLWFFEREGQSLEIETRYDNAASEFCVVVRYPDDSTHAEQFASERAFRLWLEEVERNLAVLGWSLSSGPTLLSDGWRDKPVV